VCSLLELERAIARLENNPKYRFLVDELLWRKCTALYILGREAEADALKNELMSKEPNRVFYFELKQLNETVKELKERIEYGKEQKSEAETPKETTTDSELNRKADEPSRRTSESARIRRVAYEKRRSGIDKPRVHKREVSVTSVIGLTDIVLFVFIILLALVIIIAFFFLFRHSRHS